jgi:hypothetical protein
VIRQIICFSLVLLTGCSSIAVRNPAVKQEDNVVEFNFCVKSTAEMNILDESMTGEKNKENFAENIKAAVVDIQKYANSNIVKSPFLELKELPSCPESLSSSTPESSLYLSIDLSGYGSIRPEWKKILIGTGAVEAVFQGAVVGAATQSPWLGIGVAAEEMTSEYLTWNGVDWLLGETYAPVTLEAEMIYVKDKTIIWRDDYFITENAEEIEKLSPDEQKDKLEQLNASLHKAELKLIENLNSYLTSEVL